MHESLKNIPEYKEEEIKKAITHYNNSIELALGRNICLETPCEWDYFTQNGLKSLFEWKTRKRLVQMIKEIMKDDKNFLEELNRLQREAVRERCTDYFFKQIDKKLTTNQVSKEKAKEMKIEAASLPIEALVKICKDHNQEELRLDDTGFFRHYIRKDFDLPE